MPQFAFTVTDARGQRTSGTMLAEDRDSALKTLSEQDLVVTRLTPITNLSQEVRQRFGVRGPRVSGEQLMQFTQQLSAMLDAGMTVKAAVDVMLRDTRDQDLLEVMLEMSNGLAAGSSLTELLQRFPSVFNQQFVAMVAAGESGGKLAPVLGRLSMLIEKNEDLKRKVKGAMYYPALVMTFAILMLFGLFAFGIPRFQEIYSGLGGELPMATQLMIGFGVFLSKAWPFILALVVIGGFAGLRFIQTPPGRAAYDALMLRLPLVGPLVQKLAIARFARTLSTLHSSGVPLVQSLELVADSMGNRSMEKVVRGSLTNVLEGEGIVEPLRRSGLFTEMAVSMLAAGEHSGTIDKMLDKVADFYEAQVDGTLRAMTSLIEPVIMIGVGLVVAAIIVGMILPIFRMATLLFS